MRNKRIAKGKKILAFMLGMMVAMPSVQAFGAVWADVPKGSIKNESLEVRIDKGKETTGRRQVNFNRGWKFVRSDVQGAEAVTYDDSEWVDVGIPHNFSIPYEMSAQFYVGYGWYRKEFDVPKEWEQKKVELEFEGVFQVAEVYVNGEAVGTHEGGYSGFTYDITDYLNEGKNLLAVRVNNIWQHDLAPRAGDHQFTGGIYRDVYLNVTEDVHVAWYGTFVTTPDLTNPGFDSGAKNIDFTQFPTEEQVQANVDAKRSNVRVQTEVVNASGSAKEIQVFHTVKDENKNTAAEFSSEKQTVAAGETVVTDAVSSQISGIKLWSPDTPNLYTVETSVVSGGVVTDTYESEFGFRWAQYKNDGFYLNGEKVFLDGANAHQDHAGFADAVTDEGYYRDVAMIKECGMNFIRGSHYPHDPSYAKACDELGVLFWSECNFWGMGGCAGNDADALGNAGDWFKDAYPQNPDDEEAFEKSCMDSLEAMIRVNRNHPSIINWSMGNEVFFTSGGMENNGTGTGPKAKELVNKMRNYAHTLDPTRKAGMGGCQRGGYDSLDVCDIAGYNGDGGKITNTWMPNIVAEYGSKVQDRPGEYRPYYDQIQGSSAEEYKLTTGSAGISAWCAFHHGTIGGDGLAKMGIIDYYRLPLQTWYWYREKNTGVKRESSKNGTAAAMQITVSDTEITNDGKKDAKLTVTMTDADGNWVNDTREVTLAVTDGPGILPGGKSYTFTPNKSMRDGKASIEFRSFYAGETTITAQADGLPDAQVKITTADTAGAENEAEPENFYDASLWGTVTAKIEEPILYGDSNAASGRPVFPSSNETDGGLATDGNVKTAWVAEKSGPGESFLLDLEFALYLYKLKLDFADTPYAFKIETAMDKEQGPWTEAASYTKDTVGARPGEETLDGREARYVKVTFTDVPENEKAFLSEIEVYGNSSAQAPQYSAEGAYLSDVADYTKIVTGSGAAGKDTSCEGAPISVGGAVYEKGIGVRANSSVPYETEGKYARIAGVAGIDDEASGANAVFRIFADDALIYERELSGGNADRFNLSISGVQKIRLETESPDSSKAHTDWADVKLLAAGRSISKEKTGLSVSCTGMDSGLHAGETYRALLSLKNTEKEAKNLEMALVLYDNEEKPVAMERLVKNVGAERTVQEELKMQMPLDITGHCVAVQAWDKNTLKPLSKCIYIYADRNYLKAERTQAVWETKVDGEASTMQKTGNWTLWKSNDAYEGTETCAGQAGLEISHEFTGNYVRIGAKVDASQVGADVYIDGAKAGEFSTKAGDNSTNVYRVVWTSEKLADGPHTVKLVTKGKFGLDYMEFGKAQKISEIPKEDGEQLKRLKAACAEIFGRMETGEIESYTLESRMEAAAAFDEALDLCGRENPQEAACGAAVEKLEQAIADLVKKKPDVTDKDPTPKDPTQKEPEKGGLTEAVTEAEGKKEADYTPESWDAFQKALAQVKEVLNKEGVTQEEINAAKDALQEAVRNLKPQQHTTPQPTPQPVKVPAKGSTFDVGALRYKVTKSDAKNGTVAVAKLLSKKAKKIKIPATVEKDGYTFKVTEIANGVFQKNSKITQAEIGANVNKIGAKSFYNCKKLGKITFKNKNAVKIGSKALSGIKKNCKVTVSKKMSKKNFNKIKKGMKSAGKKVSFKKK